MAASPTSDFVWNLYDKLCSSSSDLVLSIEEVDTYLKHVRNEIKALDYADMARRHLGIVELQKFLLAELMTEQAFTKRKNWIPQIDLKDSLHAMFNWEGPEKDAPFYCPYSTLTYLLLNQPKASDYKGILDVFPLVILKEGDNWAKFEHIYLKITQDINHSRLLSTGDKKKVKQFKVQQLKKLEMLKEAVHNIK